MTSGEGVTSIEANTNAQFVMQLLPLLAQTDNQAQEDLDLYVIHGLITLGVMSMDTEDPDGNRPLHLCAQRGNLPIMQDLVARSSIECLSEVNDNGNTPLHTACWFGHPEMVAWLLQEDFESEVQIDATNHSVSTPLHLASYRGHTQVAKILIEAGAYVAEEDINGNTTLHVASWGGHIETVNLLVEKEGTTDIIYHRSYAGNTALHLAAWMGHLSVVKRLVELAGHWILTLKNFHHCTPLKLATHNGHTHVAKWLLEQENFYKVSSTITG